MHCAEAMNWIVDMNRCTGPKDWREAYGYYPTEQPCCICGNSSQTGIEPRFGYVVCQTHHTLSPTEVSERRKPADS